MDDKTNPKLNKANRVFKGTLKQTLSHLKADDKYFLLTEDSNEMLSNLESQYPEASFTLISPLKTSFSVKDAEQLSENEILLTTHRCKPGELIDSIALCPVLPQSQILSIIDTTDPIACSHFSDIVRKIYHNGSKNNHVTETRFYSLVAQFDIKNQKELKTILLEQAKKYKLEQNTQKNLEQFALFGKTYIRAVEKMTFSSDGHSITCTLEGSEKTKRSWNHRAIKAVAGKIKTNSVAIFNGDGRVKIEARLPIAKMYYSTSPSAIIIIRNLAKQKKALPSAG